MASSVGVQFEDTREFRLLKTCGALWHEGGPLWAWLPVTYCGESADLNHVTRDSAMIEYWLPTTVTRTSTRASRQIIEVTAGSHSPFCFEKLLAPTLVISSCIPYVRVLFLLPKGSFLGSFAIHEHLRES